MGCLPDINWETLDFWTISPVVPTFHNKMLCSSRIVAMHRLSLFQKHQGSPEKKKKNTEKITWYFLRVAFPKCFCWIHFSKLPIFFWGGGKTVKFFGGIFGCSSFVTGFTTKALFPRALWKDATKKPIRSTEEEPWRAARLVKVTLQKKTWHRLF